MISKRKWFGAPLASYSCLLASVYYFYDER